VGAAAQAISRQTFSRMIAPTYLKPSHSYTYLPIKMGQSVPKRRHIKFRRQGITRKNAYKKLPVSAVQVLTLQEESRSASCGACMSVVLCSCTAPP
jgi:hypothetical protein